MTIQQYIEKANIRYKSGISGEHAYRGDLETLIRELVKGVEITNEPANVTDCGNPDYVITKGKIPIGYIEAKDIGKDLNSKQYKEQFTRYKKALDNLIITDYIWFRFFQNGELIHEIKIGEIENGTVKPIVENFSEFENLIQNFCTFIGQTIKSSKKLAEMMAAKARLLQDILERAITSDEETQENTSIKGQFEAFKKILIHDLTPKGFADIYAQTLAYGMFAARLNDKTLEDFSRQEAAELIPKTNPFLRKLFQYVAGYDIDERIKTTVDNLADVFRATNVDALLHNFGKSTQMHDPIIHFYETFLAAYDPKLRKSRGVWYTPEPVVNFIVRAVDDILKTEFGLPQGLADTSKTKIKVPVQGSKKMMEKEVHKVQILDPATGTGTFLAAVVKHIYNKNFKAMQGAWSGYVDEHLIPRLNGFELLMASYTMAHLKLDMLLTETGYKAQKNQRYNIYLTNSLEEYHPDTGTLFAGWLSSEANEANHIKRDTPVMCVIGNPPYAVSSSNKGEWIQNILKDYKKDLNERKINIDDDYIKFIRYGEYFINKTGEGILAYISNNSFIDGVTHRQMRTHLLESFNKIFILDLHGNSRKKETCPNGSPDQNVFDIMQGVSINIFIKKSKSKKLGNVSHFDLYGKRQEKYNFLYDNSISSINWKELDYKEPYFFFVPKDFEEEKNYKKGIKLEYILPSYGTGVQTDRDNLFIDNNKEELERRIITLLSENKDKSFMQKYNVKNSSGYKLMERINSSKFNSIKTEKYNYKPFDFKNIYYDEKLISRAGFKINRNALCENYILLVTSKNRQLSLGYFFISKYLTDRHFLDSVADSMSVFPLYLCPDSKTDGIFAEKGRKPNLNMEIVEQITEKLGLEFVAEETPPNLPEGEALKTSVGGNKEVRPGYITANPVNYRLIKEMRDYLKANPTKAEKILWEYVRNKKTGYKIRRQHIIENFITDFVCLSKKVVIEVDGKIHEKQKEYDELRTRVLNDLGYKVIRFKNEEVLSDPDKVAEEIKKVLDSIETIVYSTYSKSPSFGGVGEVFAPIDILDYIYAVLHSPTYREKYKEFLKIDFPRVPYPKDKETFWKLVKFGGEIRQIHLLESPKVEEYITSYPQDGDNTINRKLNKNDWEITDTEKQTGRIWINNEQYFDNIPIVAWEFYIGGYQPAQKWLKDRRKRKLSFEDILHYQKIIVALTETDRLMKEIDKIEIE
ncbi:MAG: DUF559 domain-containing protein [Bacteroidales bacterium]|nr:DUF559 domain-containing protein [Bacteroidales bacterium]